MSTLHRTKADICINVMPLFHLHGQIVNVLGTLVAGASVICTPGFGDPAKFFGWVAEHQPTWYSAVPTMHFAFVEHGKRLHGMFPKHRLNLIRNCSAALLPAVADAMAELWGATIVPTYGMTEVLPICSQPAGLDDSRKRGSVGPAAGPEVGIMRVDEDSDGVPTGWVMVERALDGVAGHQDGEVVVRGVCQMAGYEGDDLANAKTWLGRSGWMRTGDKGWMDADGYVSLSGRFKEIINRCGADSSSPPQHTHATTSSSLPLVTLLCHSHGHIRGELWSNRMSIAMPRVGRSGEKISPFEVEQVIPTQSLHAAPSPWLIDRDCAGFDWPLVGR